jgi:hypothetical protein
VCAHNSCKFINQATNHHSTNAFLHALSANVSSVRGSRTRSPCAASASSAAVLYTLPLGSTKGGLCSFITAPLMRHTTCARTHQCDRQHTHAHTTYARLIAQRDGHSAREHAERRRARRTRVVAETFSAAHTKRTYARYTHAHVYRRHYPDFNAARPAITHASSGAISGALARTSITRARARVRPFRSPANSVERCHKSLCQPIVPLQREQSLRENEHTAHTHAAYNARCNVAVWWQDR